MRMQRRRPCRMFRRGIRGEIRLLRVYNSLLLLRSSLSRLSSSLLNRFNNLNNLLSSNLLCSLSNTPCSNLCNLGSSHRHRTPSLMQDNQPLKHLVSQCSKIPNFSRINHLQRDNIHLSHPVNSSKPLSIRLSSNQVSSCSSLRKVSPYNTRHSSSLPNLLLVKPLRQCNIPRPCSQGVRCHRASPCNLYNLYKLRSPCHPKLRPAHHPPPKTKAKAGRSGSNRQSQSELPHHQ